MSEPGNGGQEVLLCAMTGSQYCYQVMGTLLGPGTVMILATDLARVQNRVAVRAMLFDSKFVPLPVVSTFYTQRYIKRREEKVPHLTSKELFLTRPGPPRKRFLGHMRIIGCVT